LYEKPNGTILLISNYFVYLIDKESNSRKIFNNNFILNFSILISMTTKFKTLIVVITGFLLFACKKSDFQYVSKAENKEITNRFFLYKENINPTVVTINELKFQNTKTDFIRNFALKEGFAIWDKATVSTTLKRMNKNDSTESFDNPEDTVVFIPLVLENDNKVHSYLKAILNNGVIIMLGRNGDFEKYPFNTISPDSMSAEKFAILMMSMTKHVFGTENFKIIDNRLFPQYVVNSNKPNNFKIIKITSTTDEFSKFDYVCTYTYFLHCCGCGPCVGPYCDGCHLCLSVVENYCEYENSDPYPGFPWGGSPGGGGGGTTTYDPNGGCNNGTNKIIDGIPPCPPPNDGGGWVPSDESPPSPCEKTNILKNNESIRQGFNQVKASVNLPYEIALTYTSTGQPVTVVGPTIQNGNDAQVGIPIDRFIYGYLHSHPIITPQTDPPIVPMFSVGDIKVIYDLWNTQLNNQPIIDFNSFTIGVTTGYGQSYFMVIDDLNKFISFGNTWFANDDLKDISKKYGYYNISPTNNPEVNEKSFLQFIGSLNMGASVLKANADFTQYSLLSLSHGGNTLYTTPCP
jgi:hypothetical protein